MSGQRLRRLFPACYSALLALLILGPLLGNGYLLLRDAVSTPRSYLTDAALGLGAAAPRAVPQDGLLAMVSPVLDGGLVVRAILLVALWAAGFGAAVLARELLRAPVAAQLAACTVALWNPYVAERLAQGHWSLLAGYAALPWTVLAANRIRTATGSRLRHWAALTAALAAAGLTPTGALLGGLTALVCLGARRLPLVLVLLVAACAPWLTATALTHTATETSDPGGIAAFAARAETGLGTLGSLAGLGGIWNADAVPQTRTTPLALVGTLVLLAAVALGVRAVTRRATDPASTSLRRGVLALAALAILLPALGATPWGTHVLEWLMANVPGAGLLRDTQKYVALAMPAYALCAAAGCRILAEILSGASTSVTRLDNDPTPRERGVQRVVAAGFIVLLMLSLADLAWGVGGQMRAVRYPSGWAQVAARVDGPGDIAVLPGGMFRAFDYTPTVPVLDPAPRMLPRDVLQTGELPVHGRTVSGEGTRGKQVETLLLQSASARALADAGVGWILVEHRTPGPHGESARTLAELTRVYDDPDFTLYEVPGPVARIDTTTSSQRTMAIAAHLLWLALLIGGAIIAAAPRRSARNPDSG